MTKNAIHFVDLRNKTLIDLLRSYPDKATEILTATTGMYGIFSRLASYAVLPYLDKKSYAWLKYSYNPYLHEIESFADILETPGVYVLNLCYEWACTTGTYRTDETVSMLRVMDWPFPTLGKHVFVVQQSSKAGEYYNMTWPALSGVFNGMAPGRFAAAINLAPMREHGQNTWMGSKFVDWLKNRLVAEHSEGLPPSHLLRRVFEQAANYAEAKKMLMETPIATPAIFVLSGIHQGEGCVIERLEKRAEVLELWAGQQLVASNHFITSLANEGQGWRHREIDSLGRYRQGNEIHGYDLQVDHFDWLRAPIINQRTRMCMIADASTKRLIVQGFEGMARVTELFSLPAAPLEQRQVV